VLISIITPTFNAGSTIGDALESVLSELGADTEHLLMDACSTDQTLEITKGYPHLIIRSERDSGIYDGMNKGAELACGEWLLFLQGDDWLPEGSLEAYHEAIRRHPEAEMFCGNCKAVKELDGGWAPVWSVTDPEFKKLTVRNIALWEPMIYARLIRREVFIRLGGFSLEYRLASDRDFLLRAAKSGIQQVEIDVDTYRYRWHVGSSTMTEGNSRTEQLSSENLAVAKRHLQFLDAEQLGIDDRKALRAWHTRLTVQATMNALESKNLNFLDNCLEGVRVDALWPGKFLSVFMSSIPGFLTRGCRTRSQFIQRK